MQVILCPHCSEPYSLYLFEFGIPFWCRCGYILGAPEDDRRASPESPGECDFVPAIEDDGLFDDCSEDPPFLDEGAPLSGVDPVSERSVGGDFRAQFEARIRDLGDRDLTKTVSEEARARQEKGELQSEELRRRADRICFLISSTDYSRAEIEVEAHVLKIRCQRYFPEMRDAYEHVYEPRFEKLWREFRDE